jgi:hypothetical protein
VPIPRPEQYLETVVRRATVCPSRVDPRIWRARGPTELDLIDRLGLEIALNDSIESRAISGELETLERAWRDSEEVAAIADRLLIPSSVSEKLSRLRNQ